MCKKIDTLIDQRRMLVQIQSVFPKDSTDFNRYKNLLKLVDNKIYEASKSLIDPPPPVDNKIYEASKSLIDPPPPSDRSNRHKEIVMVAGGVAVAAGVTAAVYLHFKRKE